MKKKKKTGGGREDGGKTEKKKEEVGREICNSLPVTDLNLVKRKNKCSYSPIHNPIIHRSEMTNCCCKMHENIVLM